MKTTTAAAAEKKTAIQVQGGKPAKGKKKSRVKVILIVLLAGLLAAAAAVGVLSVTRNLFGGRDWLIGSLIAMDPDFQSVAQRQAAVSQRETAIDAREATVSEKEKKLEEQEAALEAEQENSGKSAFEQYIAGLSESRQAQTKQIAGIYSGMSADAAAAALAKLGTVEEMAAVLYYMKSDSAAGLMDRLPADTAARITECMLG